jgi:3-mercaptopyruvate sulfurtransferase SseA
VTKFSPNAPPSASRPRRRSCSIASRAREASNTLVALKEAGIENVTLYFGSWNEWSRDPSLPIETGLPYTTSAAPSVAA